VSTAKRIQTPWGDVVSDADLHMVVISDGPYLGMAYDKAVAENKAGR